MKLTHEELDKENWQLFTELSRIARRYNRLWDIVEKHGLTEEALDYLNKYENTRYENTNLERKARET